jgi:hypothetical protein
MSAGTEVAAAGQEPAKRAQMGDHPRKLILEFRIGQRNRICQSVRQWAFRSVLFVVFSQTNPTLFRRRTVAARSLIEHEQWM